jgi:hypothetical protein
MVVRFEPTSNTCQVNVLECMAEDSPRTEISLEECPGSGSSTAVYQEMRVKLYPMPTRSENSIVLGLQDQ